MAISFSIKYKDKDVSPVRCIIRYRGKRYELSSGVSVETEHWVQGASRCKTGRVYPDGPFKNKMLEILELQLKELFNEYSLKNHIPSVIEVRKDLEEIRSGGKGGNEYFTDYMESEIRNSTHNDRTIKNYNTALHKIQEYEKKYGKLRFKDIDIHFYKSFKKWLGKQIKPNTKDELYTLNYFGTVIKIIVTFMNKGKIDGVHDFEGQKHPSFIAYSENADTVYLTVEELKRIHELKLDENYIREFYPKLTEDNALKVLASAHIVKNKFLIGAFTGLRVSDFNRLTSSHISNFIKIKPKKGTRKNEDVVIPIHPIIREIIDSGFDIATPISEQKINKHIKEIAEHAKINDEVTVATTLCNGSIESENKPKCKLVSTHTARRSAATNMFKSGIPSISIMKITGHKTEKSFLKYIKISQEENAEIMSKHPFFQ